MPNLPSLPRTTHLGDVIKKFPKGMVHLLALHDALLREDSELTIAERETIAGYVSGLNGCKFCLDAHKLYALAHGAAPDVIDAALADQNAPQVPEKLRPLLALVSKLNTLPVEIDPADVQPSLDAGWSEAAISDAIHICATFNYMNRVIEGFGVNFEHPAGEPSEGELAQRRAGTYSDFAAMLGIA